MERDLAPEEVRVLGCLVEKEATTPEQYPLSVNAVVNACNQKSNRDPVMALTEGDIGVTLGRLTRRGLVRMASGYGGRVSKYEHRLAGGPGVPLTLDAEQRALLCVLFLRGAQTPGELRARAARLATFDDTAAVEAVLEGLSAHSAGPLVERLVREPGKRENRYRHCLAASADEPDSPAAPLTPATAEKRSAPPTESSLAARVDALEAEVAELRARLQALQSS